MLEVQLEAIEGFQTVRDDLIYIQVTPGAVWRPVCRG